MTSSWKRLFALLLALTLIAAACGSDDSEPEETEATQAATEATDAATTEETEATEAMADEPFEVAFVHIGPVADKGWTWAHDQGAQYVKEQLGDAVNITTIELIAEGPTSQPVFEQLAEEGKQLIFGTTFGYGDSMIAASEKFPDVAFAWGTGVWTGNNVGNYFGAAEEGRYLSGMAAGAATDSNLIGYVAAFPIPEVIRGINAFALGVQEVNPDAEVQVVWTSTWFDPPVEGEAAQALLDAGADVIAMHQDSSAPGLAADAAGAKWVGYNTDMTEFAPDAWLTAAVWNWGPYYLEVVEAVMAGTWTPENHVEAGATSYGSMASGMVDIAPFGSSVSDDTAALINERKAQIIDGSFSVFPAMITDQDGNERELGDIFAMDYFVAGVIGSASG